MDVATLGLKIDGTGAIKGIGDVEGKLKGLEGKAKAAGTVLTGAFLAAGAGLAAFGLKVAKESGDAEREFAALESRIKSTGGIAGFTAGELVKIGSELQSLSTFSGGAIAGMQELLLTFTQVRGENFTAASEAILDMATVMGGDLKGAAIQVGKALNDPILGVSALAKAGVQMSESQKAAIKDMVALGDVAGAQAVILGELETQFGGAANAARNTMGGALAALRNSFDDLLEVPAIIAPITNVLNSLGDTLASDRVKGAVAEFAKSAMLNLAAFANGVAELVGLVASGLGSIAEFFGRLSGPNSPLNRFARSMQGVANAAANSQVFVDGLVDSLMTTSPTATAGGKALGTYAASTEEVGKVADTTNEVLKEQAAELKLTQRAWYDYFAELKKGSDGGALTTKPIEVGGRVSEALPIEGAQSTLEAFFGWLATEGQMATENLGSAFMTTFQNIAARGKVAFGDLFNTIAGLFKAGSGGSALFGGLAIGATVVGGAMEQRNAQVEQAKAAREAYEKEIGNFNRMLAEWAQDIAGFATDMDAALAEVNRRYDQRARDARAIFDAGNPTINTGTAAAVAALNAQIAELNRLRDEEIARIKERNEADKAALGESIEIRALEVAGLSDAADLLRLEIRQRQELAEAQRLGVDLLALENVQTAERNKLIAEQVERDAIEERERGFTIGGLDAAIAREMGNTDEADAIERDIERQRILAEVTDATIAAKYEELFALQDTNRALNELKEAAELLSRQQMMSEDLEVRRLAATGNAMEAEALRFELEQGRELRRAEAEFARGEITQEILDQLREVLGLEADAFAAGQSAQGATAGEQVVGGVPSLRGTTTGPLQSLATAQVADIDRVVGELTTIRVRSGQTVALLQAIFRGGGVVGAVNASLQNDTTRQSLTQGNIVVS